MAYSMHNCPGPGDIETWGHPSHPMDPRMGDADARRDEAILDRVTELTAKGKEFDPYSAENFSEALSESDGMGIGLAMEYFRAGDALAAGCELRSITNKYWDALATARAEADVDNAGDDCNPPENDDFMGRF